MNFLRQILLYTLTALFLSAGTNVFAENNLSKFDKDLSPIQQAGIKTQIAKAEARIASLTESQIDDYLKVATKNPNSKKVML